MPEMGRKKTRALSRRGFLLNHTRSSVFLSGSVLCCGVGAGCFVYAGSALVFLADFLDESTCHEVLKFLVGTKAKHLLTTAHGIANLEIGENALEEIVEAKDLLFRKHIAEFVSYMVREAT